MTTFKNNSKYAELLFLYLDVANRSDSLFDIPTVLRTFEWSFKGGSLAGAASGLRLQVETSEDHYPEGTTWEMAKVWPEGKDCAALQKILNNRARQGRLSGRSLLARIGTFSMLVSDFGNDITRVRITTGMRAIYACFGEIWDWAEKAEIPLVWDQLEGYMSEAVLAAAAVSHVHVPTINECRLLFTTVVRSTRVPALLQAIMEVKDLIRRQGHRDTWSLAKGQGDYQVSAQREVCMQGSSPDSVLESSPEVEFPPVLIDMREKTRFLRVTLGPMMMMLSQGVVLRGTGKRRVALGLSDMERLHQLLMSTVSAIVGVVAQASVGTATQKSMAVRAVQVAQMNVARIVMSSRQVPLGDEVLVCKGYRRAYTAHLGKLAGPMCATEYLGLVEEAKSTAGPGVLDIDGFLSDAASLDAASSLNACKMFKICPAPDVSPGAAMMDRIKQIGNGNEMDAEIAPQFESELRAQILRAHVKGHRRRLALRTGVRAPSWWVDYLRGDMDKVPSDEIAATMAWEGTAEMPDISPHDPANWKDSGIGADTEAIAMGDRPLGILGNMITRLIFDDSCPMPGKKVLSDEHVIKFFIKAEGHKDPARGIFSANLTDRFAQSAMEKAVESVASKHPSFMIGQPVDVRTEKVIQLVSPPKQWGWVALYYSFDISGWSAKMPAEPQRISHKIWGDLFDEELFHRATEINEGAFIYLMMDGYRGWFRNTHANLEGFNGKEMTMVLVALLSLSVKRWRVEVVKRGVIDERTASETSALLFAYIDDGLSRIDLPRQHAVAAFDVYKETVIDTFSRCGFSVEVTKCFPSDRFSIFLNEVYIAGRHVVHGVRAAMAISSEPTERHNSLIERVSSVATGCRGAVMAGLSATAATMLMAFHTYLHLLEWVTERDKVILTGWSFCPRAWGGLGLPNMMQLFTSGSGSAFEEGVATLQAYAWINRSVKSAFLNLAQGELDPRGAVGVLTAPLSGRVGKGYMVDSRVAVVVRKALRDHMGAGRLSIYASRLLRYGNSVAFTEYARAVVPLGTMEVVQEQMLTNLAEAHPHSVFSSFARRLEKSTTVSRIVGPEMFVEMLKEARKETQDSVEVFRGKFHR